MLVSQGMQFQVAGTEFARSKKGDHNSYNAPDSINAIDWNVRKTNKANADFYKGLIAIRKSFSPITDPVNVYKERYENWLSDDPNLIAFWVDNNTPGEWTKLVVILNDSSEDKDVALPAGSWTVLSNRIQAGTSAIGTVSDGSQYLVNGYGSVILCQGYSAPQSAVIPALVPVLMLLDPVVR